MTSSNRLPDVYAWQIDGQWYFAADGRTAPGHAVEARHYDDGHGTFLAISHGTQGMFVRDAIPWTGMTLRSAEVDEKRSTR
ncbi:hypothetical protein PLANPX_2982 [Lacipirellula parvula]|uniref:Uncharacterized protein n=1 Tax=Lacipirellula parvula TaxID=2650471 RepID=A0A5K7X9I0_9BACT|nr:hypothetical protein PLANPX_2982 [Lacipirellula parvula]